MSIAPQLRTAVAAALIGATLTACGSLTDPLSPLDPTAAVAAKGGKPKPPPPPASTHTPILFVHGWNANSSTWTTMVSRFKADGWTSAELATFSYNTSQSNATTAGVIQQKVDSILLATGATKVEIITHSMGALSARYYVDSLSGNGKVDALVSLGGPNHGTTTAYICTSTACREMYPGSSFLNGLNAVDETWGTPRYATWRSPCDEVINPHDSVILGAGPDGTVSNTLTACLTHSQLHEDATVYAQVRDWVNQPATAILAAVAP